jgi:hypothetical protein
MRAEQLQSAIARGEHVDPDELIRLTNTVRRTLAVISRREKPKTATLGDYIASRGAA